LAEALGGRIWVESELGKGSVFHFVIRVDLDNTPVEAVAPTVIFQNQRVLIVDDNAVNRKVLSRTLELVGLQPHEVDSGQAGLQWLAQEQSSGRRCDLVLLDAQMPEMDGFAAAGAIRQMAECAELPMLMLSSTGMKGDAQHAREAGISGYLTKPVAREELLLALSNVLNPNADRTTESVTRQSLKDVQQSMRVLLVEDHPVNQKLAVTLLERWGHIVAVADNGQIALDMLAQNQFDVILMDMMMPVMDGLQATRHIRASETGNLRTPIVAMTANAMESDRKRCMDAGMDDYISKPIKAQELQQILSRFALQLELANSSSANQPSPSFDYASALAEQDQEMVEIITEAFVEQWPEDVKKMREALVTLDFKSVLYTAHALKGTLSMFGAVPASQMAALLEGFAGQSDASNIAALLESFINEVQSLLVVLQANAPQ
jgi:CheY-like chemotaxis protein